MPVRVLDLEGLDDLLPSAGYSFVPVALAHDSDGREWLISRDGVPRELAAQAPSTELTLRLIAPPEEDEVLPQAEREFSAAFVPLGRLRACPVARTVTVQEFVVDPPLPEHRGFVFSPPGVALCLMVLTRYRPDRLR